MAERNPEELQREIASARQDLLVAVGRMRAVIDRNLSILERIRKRPIGVGIAAVLVLGVLLGAQVAHTLHAKRRPRLGQRIADTLRRLRDH